MIRGNSGMNLSSGGREIREALNNWNQKTTEDFFSTSLTFWVLFSDSVNNDNNYNDDKSYKNINDDKVGDNDMNNNNSFRKYILSYPEPP